MKFRRVTLEQARGHILGHNMSHAGRRLLKKGRKLGQEELDQLAVAQVEWVYVAELEPTDIGEDEAALRIARSLAEREGLSIRPAHGGRVSLRATKQGVFGSRTHLLLELNLLDGVTLATLPNHSVVQAGQGVATLKVIPFALPEATVKRAEELAKRGVVSLAALEPRRVCVVVSGSEGRRARLLEAYRAPLEQRLSGLGAHDVTFEYVPLSTSPEQELAAAIRVHLDRGVHLVIVVGETATMDSHDLAPEAIRRAGHVVGAAVFPGNLLLLGYRDHSAILGAPGCVRSRARNVVDLLLPRLLVGERLGRREVAELGQGGLLGSSGHGSGDEDGADA
jgi:molybdopterin biosynthesis enzyme